MIKFKRCNRRILTYNKLIYIFLIRCWSITVKKKKKRYIPSTKQERKITFQKKTDPN